MRTEQQIRLQGFEWENIQRAMIWDNVGRDLIREMVETDKLYKTLLDRHIISALQGFASYPSMFYSNAFCYIKNGLAEHKQLLYYADRIYQMYKEQSEKEFNSRQAVTLVDHNGMVQNIIRIK